jgi:hypothetical protein
MSPHRKLASPRRGTDGGARFPSWGKAFFLFWAALTLQGWVVGWHGYTFETCMGRVSR